MSESGIGLKKIKNQVVAVEKTETLKSELGLGVKKTGTPELKLRVGVGTHSRKNLNVAVRVGSRSSKIFEHRGQILE